MSNVAITLALLRLNGVGPGTVRALWRKFPSMSDSHTMLDALQQSGDGRSRQRSSHLEVNEALSAAYELLDRCESQGIGVLWPTKPDFPARLRTIPNPPLVLFSLGDSAILGADSVAVIGTREPTNFGVRSAKKIARTLAERGWVIVSGLAEGCDTAGHEGCLDGAGRTVAALAHGFGRIYPASNKGLAERIIAEGGCLLTEYPPGQPPTRGSFVERDRLQSGLSLGVIVIETDVKGGTMHTVRHAVEQRRPIAAVSHPERMKSEPKAQGNRLLVAEGRATALEAKKDVFDFTDSLRRERPAAEIGVAESFPVDQQELKW